MTEDEIQGYTDYWHEENYPVGKFLGYPDCCIKEFCKQPPEVLAVTQRTQDDIDRYNASLVNGKYTGFIPCAAHAKRILAGEITLESLITDRHHDCLPFPDEWRTI